MLPSSEKAQEKEIIKLVEGKTLSTNLNQLALCEFPDAISKCKWEKQNLYILSDEEIKELPK